MPLRRAISDIVKTRQPALVDQRRGGVEGRVANRVAVRRDRLAPDPRHPPIRCTLCHLDVDGST